MHTLTRHRFLRARIAWIACLAILFNVFAPLVSHAAPAAALPVMDMQVCTAMGMAAMPVVLTPDGAQDSGAGKLQKTMNHCGYCVAHAAAHGLPPPSGTAFAPAAARDVYPPLYYLSSRPLFQWAQPQPRAPPSA